MKRPAGTTIGLIVLFLAQGWSYMQQRWTLEAQAKVNVHAEEKTEGVLEYASDIHRMSGLPPTTRWVR